MEFYIIKPLSIILQMQAKKTFMILRISCQSASTRTHQSFWTERSES